MTTILDTNVASEIVSPRPNPVVMDWWRSQILGDMFTTAVTEAEMRYGLAIMPAGHRHSSLLIRTDHLLRVYLAGRILPFNSAAAQIYAAIRSHRRSMGRPISLQDCQIAAIARSNDMAVATRNIADFTDCGVELVNPWSAEGTSP